jgi:tetratricopeptide (TPR) repeat protein
LLRQAEQAATTCCVLVPDCAENHANRARFLVEQARMKLCPAEQPLAAFDRALALDPHNGVYLAEAARAAVAVGRLDAAAGYLKRGLALDPELGEMRFAQASLCAAKNQFDEAARHLQRAHLSHWCNNDGPRDHALLLWSYVQLQRHRPGLSLPLSEDVLRRQPHSPSAHWLRGQALEALGRKSEAIAEYRLVAEGQGRGAGF